tara:strand:- start:75 stop:272 length:198 start_codon:yes stop_codon:yes gene_type:complete
MAMRGMFVCPSDCDCSLKTFCGVQYPHYEASVPTFESGFMLGTALAGVFGLLVIVIEVRRFTARK